MLIPLAASLPATLFAAGGLALSGLFLLFSPLRNLKDYPSASLPFDLLANTLSTYSQ